MSAPLFAILASLICAPGIAFVCLNAMKKVAVDPENVGLYQSKMFMNVAMVEAIPMIFIILAFIQLPNGGSAEVYPNFVALLLIVVGSVAYLVSGYKKLRATLKKPVDYLKTMLPISLALMFAVPIVSFVILMIQSSQNNF